MSSPQTANQPKTTLFFLLFFLFVKRETQKNKKTVVGREMPSLKTDRNQKTTVYQKAVEIFLPIPYNKVIERRLS